MSRSVTRRRSQVFDSVVGSSKTFSGTTLIDDSPRLCQDKRLQRTDSQGNPYRSNYRRHLLFLKVYGYDPSGSADIGGPFTTFKAETFSYPKKIFSLKGGNVGSINYSYDGRAVAWARDPNITEGDFLQPSTGAQLDAIGTTAIARCIPTNPLSGMGQFLGELHDLPKVPDIRNWVNRARNWRNGAKRINFDKLSREAAGEYLNQVFGWVPFVNDLDKFTKTVKNAGPIMEKFAKDSNHLIHRSYYFPDVTTVTTQVLSSNSYPDPPLNGTMWINGGVLTKTVITTTKTWFKGAFTYYLPGPEKGANSFVERINKLKFAEQQANRLSGTRLTPDLLWKLAPWSWAVDWVTNAGDVIHNWSAFANDGLVMDYGYVMEHKIRQEQYSLVGVQTRSGPETFYQEFRYETKTRKRATPYGFGVNPASFTTKQWSIVAALGISKQPLSLNF